MTPKQFENAAEECIKAMEEFALFMKQDNRSKEALGHLKGIVALAKAAIPSGQVAEDEALIQRELAEGGADYAPHLDALSRLTAKAQSAQEWKAKYEQEHALRMTRQADADAANAAKEAAIRERTEATERAARLSAAGQVLSAHVDKTAGAPLGPYEMARNALGGDLAKLPNIEPGAAETEDCGHEAEVERLRAVLGNIATACEAKDLRLYAPSKQALDAQRKVIENVWRWATAAAGGEVVQSEHVDKAPTITTEEWTAMGEDSEPGTSVPRGSPPEWTMRDEFAKAALQGILANPTTQEKPDICAKAAYIAADAMIAARGNAVDITQEQEKAWETEARKHAAEQMRAACLAEALDECATFGLGPAFREAIRRAIEGAAP